MRILFLATAEIACPLLRALHASPHDVAGVISQPDRSAGRRRRMQASPVKQLALELDLRVETPLKIGDEETMDLLETLKPDLQIVFAYGQYIPSRVTEFPPHRSINVHPSMLPAYRGAAPIQWAIADGLDETGISVIYVSREMDAGDILMQKTIPICPRETAASLSERMAQEAASICLESIDALQQPEISPRPQDENQISHARKFTTDDRRIDWKRSAFEVVRWIHACNPWPGTLHKILVDEPPIKLLLAEEVEGQGDPGKLLRTDSEGPVFGAGVGAVRVLELQVPGRKKIGGDEFVRGYLSRG